MTDQLVVPGTAPQPTPTPAPAPAPAAPQPAADELAYLQQHGIDTSDLARDIETLLARGPTDAAPPVQPQPQPTPAPAPLPPATQQQPPVQTPPQDAALDPYAPQQNTKTPAPEEDAEPGEVMIDGDGKVRDARTGKYVPHQALHAERLKRKEVENEVAQLREREARAEERLRMLTQIMEGQQQALQPQQTKQPTVEPDIDPEVDLFGAVKQLKKRNEFLEQQLKETKDSTNQHVTQLQVQDRYRQDTTKFVAENPDFFDAYRHLQASRETELKILGLTTQQAIDTQMRVEESNLVLSALKNHKSPAEMMYALAKAKGYRGKQPVPQPTPAPAPQPAPVQVQQPTPQPQYQYQQPSQQPPQAVQLQPSVLPSPNPQAVQQVQHLQNGVQNSATLSGMGGTAGDGLTVQQLAEMPEDQFLQLAGKIGYKKLDQLLRGA